MSARTFLPFKRRMSKENGCRKRQTLGRLQGVEESEKVMICVHHDHKFSTSPHIMPLFVQLSSTPDRSYGRKKLTGWVIPSSPTCNKIAPSLLASTCNWKGAHKWGAAKIVAEEISVLICSKVLLLRSFSSN